MLTLEEIIERIEKSTNYTKDQIYDRILKKQMELSGLVSLEGAAHLVAKDLGIDLLKEFKERRLQIGNIIDGMKSVDIVGRVFFISEPVEFERDDGSIGKVISIYVGDDTGFVRVPLWDKQTKLVEDKLIEIGDIVEIKNGVARETKFGMEVKLTPRSSITTVESAIDLPSVEELLAKHPIQKSTVSYPRVKIKDIEEGPVEVRGFVVQVFKTDFVYEVCPECKSRLVDGECKTHGKVTPKHLLVINSILDDGTGHVRVVFFDDVAEKLVGVKAKEIFNLSPEEKCEKIKERILGKELIVVGMARKNEVFDRMEISARRVKKVNVLKEIKMLLEGLNGQ
ncbi:MAG: DUF2240 family protein [Candidatus Aenigmarchaeota archaeon]|nr:DUF2240 family protein [Candidatus Aenigmarchaeota archaeon]